MKKILLSLFLLLALVACKAKPLPLPETQAGLRGELGVDKNINEETIDEFLNRNDVVYRDMRMLVDVADFEQIGGDSYLSGFIKGFEIVPYPYLCNPTNLPKEVGSGYVGKALYSLINGEYVANYKESESIINDLFPKDKTIFLMCGGGGYANSTKQLLLALGYDENKIYNVGGYWYYEGNNNIEVKNEKDGKISYNYDLLTYHEINFDELEAFDGYNPEDGSYQKDKNPVSIKMKEIDSLEMFNNLINDNETFLMYVYLPGCTSCASFKPIVEEFIEQNDVLMYQINYQELKTDENNIVINSIDYAPSIFIFKDGSLLSYLNPVKDEDLDKYKTTENLSNWISDYIDVEIVKTNSENNNEGCSETACKL